MTDAALVVMVLVNFVLVAMAVFCLVPALKKRLEQRQRDPRLAYLALLPGLFLVAVVWYVMTSIAEPSENEQ